MLISLKSKGRSKVFIENFSLQVLSINEGKRAIQSVFSIKGNVSKKLEAL